MLYCRDSMTKKMLVNLNVRIPQQLKEALNQHLKLSLHVNLSEFTRDALREKLRRDFLDLDETLFETKKMNDVPSKLERLDLWSEIIGEYLGTYTIDRFTYVRIGKKHLMFDSNSKEIETIRNQLKNDFIDQTVGILRTDYPETPLIVRLIKRDK